MQLKKTPFQFWHYRDTRKQKFGKISPPELPKVHTANPSTVKAIMSHHLLIPVKDMPPILLQRFQKDVTLRNPMFEQSRKYGKGFVPLSIPEFVHFYAQDSQYLGLPRSVKMDYVHARFKDCGLKLEIEDKRPEFEKVTFKEKGKLKPFFYQYAAIEKILNGNVVLKFRCGRGKTIMALMAIAKYRLRALILVRTNILVTQWVQAIHQIFDVSEDEVGIINGKYKRHGLITVATEQSLVSLSREDKRIIGQTYGHILIDEAHEVGAEQYSNFMTFFKAKKMTGLTATPEREDGMTPVLKLYIGPIVEVDDLGELDTKICLRRTNFTWLFTGQKLKYHELMKALIHDHERNLLIVKEIADLVWKGHTVACYSSRIEHMEILEGMFKELMPEVPTEILASRRYGQNLKTHEQDEVRERVNNKEVRVLFGGKIIEQGFDCPPLSAVVLATPTKSRRLIEQVLGRAQREYLGKKEAILVDFIDEQTRVLLCQFFAKNRRIYKKYKKIHLSEV